MEELAGHPEKREVTRLRRLKALKKERKRSDWAPGDLWAMSWEPRSWAAAEVRGLVLLSSPRTSTKGLPTHSASTQIYVYKGFGGCLTPLPIMRLLPREQPVLLHIQ